MKKKFYILALAGTLMLTSCGADKSSESGNTAFYDSKSYNAAEYNEETPAPENQDNSEDTSSDYKQSEVKKINTQMLIYSCDMNVDVLEFDESVDKLHKLIDDYDGFIENENYSDGGNTSKWQYASEEKWKNLNAVIRIPSSKYDDFCAEIEAIGDMRSKKASVQNLTTEYSDLKTTLSIYEAKEQRYLDMLAEIKNDAEALRLENELTSIQIEIAKIKTRMNNIENDTAYSFINLSLNEVREYSEEPVVVKRKDTFGQRFKNRISKTWDGFLYFLEKLLFFIIAVFPYLLLMGALAFVIVKLVKFLSKKSEMRQKKILQQRMQPPVPPQLNNGMMNNKQPVPPQLNNGAMNNQPPTAPNNNNNNSKENNPPTDKK